MLRVLQQKHGVLCTWKTIRSSQGTGRADTWFRVCTVIYTLPLLAERGLTKSRPTQQGQCPSTGYFPPLNEEACLQSENWQQVWNSFLVSVGLRKLIHLQGSEGAMSLFLIWKPLPEPLWILVIESRWVRLNRGREHTPVRGQQSTTPPDKRANQNFLYLHFIRGWILWPLPSLIMSNHHIRSTPFHKDLYLKDVKHVSLTSFLPPLVKQIIKCFSVMVINSKHQRKQGLTHKSLCWNQFCYTFKVPLCLFYVFFLSSHPDNLTLS